MFIKKLYTKWKINYRRSISMLVAGLCANDYLEGTFFSGRQCLPIMDVIYLTFLWLTFHLSRSFKNWLSKWKGRNDKTDKHI